MEDLCRHTFQKHSGNAYRILVTICLVSALVKCMKTQRTSVHLFVATSPVIVWRRACSPLIHHIACNNVQNAVRYVIKIITTALSRTWFNDSTLPRRWCGLKDNHNGNVLMMICDKIRDVFAPGNPKQKKTHDQHEYSAFSVRSSVNVFRSISY